MQENNLGIPTYLKEKILKVKIASLPDADKATVLYNFVLGIENCHRALQELAQETGDKVLKQQIEERIWYETEAIRRFHENPKGKFVYIVYEYRKDLNDDLACGFFRDAEEAVLYGKKKAQGERFEIHKQEIVCGNELPRQRCGWRSNPNLFPELAKKEETATKEYDGSPIAVMQYIKGELMHLGTLEMTPEEEKKVDSYLPERFESRFVELKPYPFERGDYVVDIESGLIGIIETGKEEYQSLVEYRHFVEPYGESWRLDFTDSTVRVEFLSEEGCHHEHIHPVYLEKVSEEEYTKLYDRLNDKDRKTQ